MSRKLYRLNPKKDYPPAKWRECLPEREVVQRFQATAWFRHAKREDFERETRLLEQRRWRRAIGVEEKR